MTDISVIDFAKDHNKAAKAAAAASVCELLLATIKPCMVDHI